MMTNIVTWHFCDIITSCTALSPNLLVSIYTVMATGITTVSWRKGIKKSPKTKLYAKVYRLYPSVCFIGVCGSFWVVYIATIVWDKFSVKNFRGKPGATKIKPT